MWMLCFHNLREKALWLTDALWLFFPLTKNFYNMHSRLLATITGQLRTQLCTVFLLGAWLFFDRKGMISSPVGWMDAEWALSNVSTTWYLKKRVLCSNPFGKKTSFSWETLMENLSPPLVTKAHSNYPGGQCNHLKSCPSQSALVWAAWRKVLHNRTAGKPSTTWDVISSTPYS